MQENQEAAGQQPAAQGQGRGGQRSASDAARLASEAMETAEARHESWMNQHRDEPMPASHDAGRDQAEPARLTGQDGGEPDGPAVAGDAVRDMMGGPPPQGDVPDAPGTQIAATRDEEESGVTRVRRVANAVPGKPDGEVDTRSLPVGRPGEV